MLKRHMLYLQTPFGTILADLGRKKDREVPWLYQNIKISCLNLRQVGQSYFVDFKVEIVDPCFFKQ